LRFFFHALCYDIQELLLVGISFYAFSSDPLVNHGYPVVRQIAYVVFLPLLTSSFVEARLVGFWIIEISNGLFAWIVAIAA
jgi:hypothetical protein